MRAFEPLLHHVLGKGRAAFVEQPLNAARRYFVARRNSVDRKARLGEVTCDIVPDHLHPSRPDPAALNDCGGIARRAQYLGKQIVDMRHGRMLQAGVSERRRLVLQQREISLEQHERRRIARDAAE